MQIWVPTSYKEFYNKSLLLAKALKLLGMNFKDTVSILAFNHPKWAMIFWGSVLGNCIPVGQYLTNNAETCKDIINDSSSRIIFVDSVEQLKKIQSVGDQVPSLEYVITFDKFKNVDYVSQEDLIQIVTR